MSSFELPFSLSFVPSFNPMGLRVAKPIDDSCGGIALRLEPSGTVWFGDGTEIEPRTAEFRPVFTSAPRYELEIDLGERATRCRLIEWLAPQVGVRLATSTPSWGRSPFKTFRMYEAGTATQATFGVDAERWGNREHSRSFDVPELASLDDAFSARLEDGSDRNLVLALALVLRSFGENPR